MSKIVTLILLVFGAMTVGAQESAYQENLKIATQLFLSKSIIPDSVLLNLVPGNDEEFGYLYGTTNPDNIMNKTGFFDDVTQRIFNKVIVEKQDKFYLPGIQLASFSDGEFGETFNDNLEKIILLDKNKFCKSANGKKYAEYNPIKYYLEQYKCK